MRVLMVCTGNICRSPTAEGLLAHMAERRGLGDRLEVDSCGVHAYHTGEAPDPRSRKTAAAHGISIGHQRARQICRDDFHRFDVILAMDRSHLRDLQAMKPIDAKARLATLLSFVPDDALRDVPDPYYGHQDGFETTFAIIEKGMGSFLDEMELEGSL